MRRTPKLICDLIYWFTSISLMAKVFSFSAKPLLFLHGARRRIWSVLRKLQFSGQSKFANIKVLVPDENESGGPFTTQYFMIIHSNGRAMQLFTIEGFLFKFPPIELRSFTCENWLMRFYRLNDSGMSLGALVVSVGLMVLLTMLATNVILETKKIEIGATQSESLHFEHQLNLQKSRSMQFIKSNLPLTPALKDCFSKRAAPGSCQIFNAPVELTTQTPGCQQSGCGIQSRIRFQPSCTNNLCSSLAITVTTLNLNPNSNQKVHSSRGTLPAFIFAEDINFDYSCAFAGGTIISLDYVARRAICGQMTENTNCTDLSPVVSFQSGNFVSGSGVCTNAAQDNCGTNAGIRTLNFFMNSGNCIF